MASPAPSTPSAVVALWQRLREAQAGERLESLSGWRLIMHLVEPGRLALRFARDGAPEVALRLVPHRAGAAAAASGERFDVIVAIEGEGATGEARRFVELASPWLLAVGEGRTATAELRKLPVVSQATAGGKADRLELFISDHCNIACSFCWESERNARHQFMPWATITGHLDAAAARGVALVQWLGGEASAHPRFLEALAYARELGLRNYLITNLLAFSSERFARDAAPLLDELMISMHAHGEEGGRRVTGRAGWWPTFQRAIANTAQHYRGDRRASTVLTRDNVDDIEKIADVLLPLSPRAWVFGNPVPAGHGKDRFAELALTLSEQRALAPRLAALAARCKAGGTQLMLFCFAQCVVGPELADLTHDNFMDEMALDHDDRWDEEVHVWPRAESVTEVKPIRLARVRPPVCGGCARRARCGGYFVPYFRKHGDGELRPYPAR